MKNKVSIILLTFAQGGKGVEEEYTLFGIRSNLSDFTLVYFLNKHLNMGLNREKNDLSIIHLQMKIFFSLFNYYDYETNNQWSVIKNKTRFKNIVIEKNNLFATRRRRNACPRDC